MVSHEDPKLCWMEIYMTEMWIMDDAKDGCNFACMTAQQEPLQGCNEPFAKSNQTRHLLIALSEHVWLAYWANEAAMRVLPLSSTWTHYTGNIPMERYLEKFIIKDGICVTRLGTLQVGFLEAARDLLERSVKVKSCSWVSRMRKRYRSKVTIGQLLLYGM